jgi:hypothetical protein
MASEARSAARSRLLVMFLGIVHLLVPSGSRGIFLGGLERLHQVVE